MKRFSAVLLTLLLAAFALPLVVLVIASLCKGDLIDFLKGSQPTLTFSAAQYTRFFANANMLHRFGNSLKITGGTLLIQLPVALLGGLYLARCTWRSTRTIRFLLLVLLLLSFAEAWNLVESPAHLRPASMALNDITSQEKGGFLRGCSDVQSADCWDVSAHQLESERYQLCSLIQAKMRPQKRRKGKFSC